MNIHKNARLTPLGRERIVMQVLSGQTPQAVARAAGVCSRTVRKWVQRFEAEGIDPLSYGGRRVRVRGWIKSYNGPMIEPSHPEQIEVLEE